MSEIYKKTKKSVQDLTEDMILATGLMNTTGVLILSAGTLLNKYTIKKLKEMKISEVWVYCEDNAEPEEEQIKSEVPKKVKSKEREVALPKAEIYSRNKKVVENIIADIERGEVVSIDTMTRALDILMKQFDSNKEILQAIDYFRNADNHLYTHSVNVALLCFLMGKWLNMEKGKIQKLICSGLLHDIGKTRGLVEDNKEIADEKVHPAIGYKMLKEIDGIDEDVLQGVLMHHEREDGTGYPFEVKFDKINEFAKIIAIVDTYDLLVTNKIGKENKSLFKVLEIFEKESFGLFAPNYLSVFLKNIASYYIGDKVYLNTGEEAEIIFINSQYISKPLIRIGDRYVDTLQDTSIYIV